MKVVYYVGGQYVLICEDWLGAFVCPEFQGFQWFGTNFYNNALTGHSCPMKVVYILTLDPWKM